MLNRSLGDQLRVQREDKDKSMRFSTRTRYGLRFLAHLTTLPEGELLQLEKIAAREEISFSYLEQIVRALQPLGILRAVRGAGGGYALSKAPEEINLADVIERFEGEKAPVPCLSTQCDRQDVCPARNFWLEFEGRVQSYLRSKTLRDLDAPRSLKACSKLV